MFFDKDNNFKILLISAFIIIFTLILYTQHTNILNNHFFINLIIFFVLLIIFILIYKNLNQKKLLKIEIDKQTKELTQTNEELKIKTLEVANESMKVHYLNIHLEKKIQEELEKNRKKEQQMIEQSRLAQMGEMISMIAHQWRQPLGAISSTTINLRMQLELGTYDLNNKETQKECEEFFLKELIDIEEYVQNLTNTIDDFRNFYKPNKEPKIVFINNPIQKALGVIKTSLEVDGIKIVEIYTTKKEISIFDSEMMQVILNILKNAQDNFKYKKIENKTVTIKTTDTTNGTEISICDNGGGIPKDILPNIFDPYFSTKNEKNGTGLGLYMTKIIIEDHHNGKIKAINTNNGICFLITLNDFKNLDLPKEGTLNE